MLKIINYILDYNSEHVGSPKIAVSFGMFDGDIFVHKEVIRELKIYTRIYNLKIAVLSFDSRTHTILNPKVNIQLLNISE